MKNNLRIIYVLKKQLVFLAILFLIGSEVNAQEVINTKKYLDPPQFVVKSDNGMPLVYTNISATVTLSPGEIVTFTAIPAYQISISEIVTWSIGTSSTFNGLGILSEDTKKFTYTAISQSDPSMKEGVDMLLIVNGEDNITITIIVSPMEYMSPCDTTKPLTVIPGNDGTVSISPLSSFTITAGGGTCQYTWSLVNNFSINASLVRKNNISAVYTAGYKESSVDVIELSDGLTIKRIEITVKFSVHHGDGIGCFIRNKRSQRD